MCLCKQAHEYIPLRIPLLPLFTTTKRESVREAYFESTYEISILENYYVVEDVFFFLLYKTSKSDMPLLHCYSTLSSA